MRSRLYHAALTSDSSPPIAAQLRGLRGAGAVSAVLRCV